MSERNKIITMMMLATFILLMVTLVLISESIAKIVNTVDNVLIEENISSQAKCAELDGAHLELIEDYGESESKFISIVDNNWSRNNNLIKGGFK
ncbi:hypothetical protein GCM10008931_43530 [Oceanobacillus oncorhynchi subsp. oncorhynchi]|uniref:hypothetical protein n=1 Tax=Oceanobacillus oncorhynchi TaxID=545501 RepID=UPI0031DB4EC4